MSSDQQLYSVEDLSAYSELQLIETLKTRWMYGLDRPFEIIGKLVGKLNQNNNNFFVLEELHSVIDGSILEYPLSAEGVFNTLFVGPLKAGKFKEGEWVKTLVTLSPKEERDKRNNPFYLMAVSGTVNLLQILPVPTEKLGYYLDDKLRIESWVLDFYRSKSIRKIEKEEKQQVEQLNKDKERVQNDIEKLTSMESSLTNKVEKSQQQLSKNMRDLERIFVEKKKQQIDFLKQKAELEYKLNKLTEYIKNTSSILLDLDLVSPDQVNSMLGGNLVQTITAGHDFETVFESDEQNALSYIQAFMYKKDIMYRRSVLEDFFALARTHDLIILAGDSGSGKTNLVKSFAEAIGGKSIIIPVKPNWTSAEDLLGYYNPLEQKYITTPFLEALFEAKRNPDIPYFICLDEMNLARVEYYFADFLSLLEERNVSPEIALYSDSESEHLLSEARNFLALVDDSKLKLDKPELVSFLDLMRDEKINAKLHEVCGFREGDSLLMYHARLRKMLHSYLDTPAKLALPTNVRIIGAINVDETTHYLSPKILDRAHLIRFSSPLLTNWEEIDQEIKSFDLDMKLPVCIHPDKLGLRKPYPKFDRNDKLVQKLLKLANEYLNGLGIEFGMRTVRQARNYQEELIAFGASDELVFNNIVLHKVLPKMMFDGEKTVDKGLLRKDLLVSLKDHLRIELPSIQSSPVHSCIDELERVIKNAESNDWVVNYWSR